jgi:hypothetical protein
VSSFRLIFLTALSAVVLVAAAGAAAAQTATPREQSGKPYLAGLRPPHDPHKSAHLKATQPGAQHTPTAKITRVATKGRQTVTAKVKHRPVRLADKINSRVAWPGVKPPEADERGTSDTVLQFATQETTPTPAQPPHPAASASNTKAPPPAAMAATDEGKVDPDVTGATSSASTPVQTERFAAPPSTQMRVIMAAPNAELIAGPASKDESPAPSSSSAAQLLATLAGAISAGIVGWLMIGFGRVRTIRSGT